MNEFNHISAVKAHELIAENNSDLIIIDLRTEFEFLSSHLENAVNIDIYNPNFEEEIKKLDRNKIYLLYCARGNRSSRAMELMKTFGFRKIYNVLDSIV